ncbi:MAG: class I SAM-dependent methyltransferase [Rhodospirillales bacterium]|jgi:SAM-dependent methyltransferase
MSEKSFEFSTEDIILVQKYIETYPNQTLHIPGLRAALTAARIDRLKPEDIKTFERSIDKDLIENTVEHNIQALKQATALARPDILIRPITSTNKFRVDSTTMKVLTIGPRTEAEVFSLMAAGFAPQNITGLDLISYSPFVELGDMHAMPYGNDSFDVIILGWVLGYSQNVPKAAAEIMRVAKPGAYIAIGHENDPTPREVLDEQRGFSLEGTDFSTSEEILDLFDGHVDKVTFREDVAPGMENQVCHVMAVFRLK